MPISNSVVFYALFYVHSAEALSEVFVWNVCIPSTWNKNVFYVTQISGGDRRIIVNYSAMLQMYQQYGKWLAGKIGDHTAAILWQKRKKTGQKNIGILEPAKWV
jgi:hypothetical protein